jgi:AcrR family transcriptional regulator
MARKSRQDTSQPLHRAAEDLRRVLVDTATERATAEVARHVDNAVTKALARTTSKLEEKGLLAESLDFWTRNSVGIRKPRISRSDIAEVAIRVADAEGFDAVSMRRLAIELDVGTMTLYHYLRTKDELLTLLVDTVIGEVLLPPGQKLPKRWKPAAMLIATRSRDALRHHPWVLDITDAPRVGPNALAQFDQCLQALDSYDGSLNDKLDLLAAVDEYVIGFCAQERTNDRHGEKSSAGALVDYIEELVSEGSHPALSALTTTLGVRELWSQVVAHAGSADRFERNLTRLLTGFDSRRKR